MTYSLQRDGNKQLSLNFRLREFASRCGADTVTVDSDLVDVLQRMRDELGVPITINSGFRTPAHNASPRRVQGSPTSQHLTGKAADIVAAGVSTTDLCRAAERALAAQGIPGNITRYHTRQNFVHIDVRATRTRREHNGSGFTSVAGWANQEAGVRDQGAAKPLAGVAFAVGDNVILNGRVHSDSFGGGPGRKFENRRGTITRVVDTSRAAPIHIDHIGWVGIADLTKG